MGKQWRVTRGLRIISGGGASFVSACAT